MKSRKLRGITPTKEGCRMKLMIYGEAKVGKTSSIVNFPKAYIIDTESGTTAYFNEIQKNNSKVLKENNFDEIYEELKTLKYVDHPYKTLIFDSITSVYLQLQLKWIELFENNSPKALEHVINLQDFGMRYWQKVKSDWSRLTRLLETIDMNIVLVSQEKDKYVGQTKVGQTFDSYKKDDYLVDYIFRLKYNEKDCPPLVVDTRQRAPMGSPTFPESFEFTYENVCKYYGKNLLEKDSKKTEIASPEQIDKLTKLIELLQVPDEVCIKWISKAKVDSFDEMKNDCIQKCIDYLQEKIEEKTND